MQIIDLSKEQYPDGAVKAVPESGAARDVAAEHWMDVLIDERPAMRVVCTPEHLDEQVAGRLLTEGLVRSAEEIETIYICEQGFRARVMLRGEAGSLLSAAQEDVIATCCTDNRTLLQGGRREIPPVRPAAWSREWVTRLAERMGREEPLYGATHAVHSCYLAMEDRVLCCREDIGRHNAMDKAVGWACVAGVDLSRCLLFTTGRMPSDMVSKAARAGVPLLASKTYPTDRGIELAKAARLTLVTLRPGGEWIVWNDGTKA